MTLGKGAEGDWERQWPIRWDGLTGRGHVGSVGLQGREKMMRTTAPDVDRHVIVAILAAEHLRLI